MVRTPRPFICSKKFRDRTMRMNTTISMRLHVGAGGDHVDGDGDARVVAGAEVLQELLGLGAVGGLVGDLGDHVVALAELLAADAHDVLGVAVVLGEDQRLGDVAQPAVLVDLAVGEHRRQVVAEGADDGADLVLGDDLPVELLLVVDEVLVDLLQPLVAGLAVAERGASSRPRWSSRPR